MRRSSEHSLVLGLVLALVFNAACGGDEDSNGTAKSGGSGGALGPVESAGTPSPSVGNEPAAAKSPVAGGDATGRAGIGGRTRELVNPEPESVVMLYHALSQLAFPFDRVIGEDMRVSMAKPIDKQAQRDAVRAELEGALAAVQDVGSLRISMNANLSDYDPTYGEFTVRALAPSSVVTFDAFREHVELRFNNGLAAQTWKVPADEAQLVRDKIGQFQSASVDVLVRITGVQPAAGGGGTLQTEIVEYELRADPSGERLTRVQVAE